MRFALSISLCYHLTEKQNADVQGAQMNADYCILIRDYVPTDMAG